MFAINGAEVVGPGAGLETVMAAIPPGVALVVPDTEICVSELTVAVIGTPPTFTVAPGAKPLPLIMKLALPRGITVGLTELIVGTGFCSVTVDSPNEALFLTLRAPTLTEPLTAEMFSGEPVDCHVARAISAAATNQHSGWRAAR